MILPEPYRDELMARLTTDIEDTALEQILALMHMNMPKEDTPDFQDLVLSETSAGTSQHRGYIPFAARFEALGFSWMRHFRYVYTCALDIIDEGIEPDSRDLNQVARLEYFSWPYGSLDPVWEKVTVDLLDDPMLIWLDDCVFDREFSPIDS